VEVVSIIIILLSIWGIVATQWTYQDRGKVIAAVYSQDDWHDLRRGLDRTTFTKHMWYRFFLRTPWVLYDPRVVTLVKKGAGRRIERP